MANRYATQGRVLIQALKRRAHTYGDMLAYGISTAPWKRVTEALEPHEAVKKGKRGSLVTWRVVAASRWTAFR